jgi:hypothetical protein
MTHQCQAWQVPLKKDAIFFAVSALPRSTHAYKRLASMHRQPLLDDAGKQTTYLISFIYVIKSSLSMARTSTHVGRVYHVSYID